MSDTKSIQVRMGLPSDLPAILNLATVVIDPWEREQFDKAIDKKTNTVMLAESDGGLVGYMFYTQAPGKFVVLNLRVDARMPMAAAKALVDKLRDKRHPERRRAIELEVRETDLPRQFFFADLGFIAVGTLDNHYEDTGEAAYVFQDALPNVPPALFPKHRLTHYLAEQKTKSR